MQIGRSFRGLPQSPRRPLDRLIIPVHRAGPSIGCGAELAVEFLMDRSAVALAVNFAGETAIE